MPSLRRKTGLGVVVWTRSRQKGNRESFLSFLPCQHEGNRIVLLRTEPPPRAIESLSGLIERVTFHNDENGFCVLQVKAKGHRDLVTVVGSLASVSAWEWVTAEGRWVQDRDFGQQFRADMLNSTAPTTREGIEKYLGSGMVKGIGPVYAKKLVEKFGEKIFDIIEQESGRLEDVDGIGPKRRQRIKDAWAEQKVIRTIMVFLHSNGVSTSRAVRIYKTYGEGAIEKVQADVEPAGLAAVHATQKPLIAAAAGDHRVLADLAFQDPRLLPDGGQCVVELQLRLVADRRLHVAGAPLLRR